jgi:methylenetetrahydrofolate reductase (NADPH)
MAHSVRDCFAAGKTTFSFEFFPPKSDADMPALWQAIRELESLGPDFVSVTYGAGGTTRDTTISITEKIASDTTLLPVAHLTAVDHSVAELRSVIGHLAAAGISNVLALRGDPPGDPQGQWVRHSQGLEYAGDLVALVKNHGDFSVGVAVFPYKHPRSATIEEDTRRFVEKTKRGADYAITQMFYEAEAYLRLRDRVTAAGGAVPIVAGLMPITNIGMIHRSEQFTGAPFPAELGAKFDAIKDDPKAVRALGIEETSKLAETLLSEGVPGIHFYTLNKSKATREVWANLIGSAAVAQSR